MSIQNKRKCIVCGGELAPGKRGGQRKFCSIKCSSSYNNRKTNAKPSLRGGKVNCPQCGNSFGRSDKSKRECCSRTCAHIWNWRVEVEELRQKAAQQKELDKPGDFRSWVLELYDAGYTRGAIAEALNIPMRTLRGWINQQNKENNFDALPKMHMYYCGCGNAQTAEEWLAALRSNPKNIDFDRSAHPEIDNRQIYLVYGEIGVRKGSDTLCADIHARLGMNPFSGKVFAYCGKRQDCIRYIFWDGGGFRTVSRRKESGAYLWPSSMLGVVIPVTSNDFELILRINKNLSSHRIMSWNHVGC